VETVSRADLLWDDKARGLCQRVNRDRSKSFVFVYRIGDRQRFIRIGTSPLWTLETARARAKQLRSIIDQGRDPACENLGRESMPPVEDLIHYIAENLVTKATESSINGASEMEMANEDEFDSRVQALLEQLKKAAGLSEGPMSLGDLDILAAASMELLALAIANMPKSMREIRLKGLPAILAADVAQKRKRIEQTIEQAIPKGSA